MPHRIALPDFCILLSKLGNRKFNPTGICNEGAGLVAILSVKIMLKRLKSGAIFLAKIAIFLQLKKHC